MDDNITRFEKFIIKKIVDTVSYNPKTEKYQFNRIQISDDILKSIDSEGIRHGLKRDVIRNMVTNLATNIKINPSIDEIRSIIKVDNIAPATHLEIVIKDEVKGRRSVDLLSIGDFVFYVLSSDIAGVEYGMKLLALDRVWANSYMIDFRAIRDEKSFPSRNHILRIGKIESVNVYRPSVIHDILDADTDYAVPINEVGCIPKQMSRKLNKSDKQKEEETPFFSHYYVWTPSRLSPITFCLVQSDKQDPLSTFIVYGDGNKMAIEVNRAFIFPTDINQKKFLLDTIKECCVCNEKPYDASEIRQIKTIKKGVLEQVVNNEGNREWVLKEKPRIKYIYNE